LRPIHIPIIKFVPVEIVRSNFRTVDTAEAKRAFDLQIQTRKSRTAADSAKRDARDGGDSTLRISRGEKPPQEKPADRS
jgi:hypothetical protein